MKAFEFDTNNIYFNCCVKKNKNKWKRWCKVLITKWSLPKCFYAHSSFVFSTDHDSKIDKRNLSQVLCNTKVMSCLHLKTHLLTVPDYFSTIELQEKCAQTIFRSWNKPPPPHINDAWTVISFTQFGKLGIQLRMFSLKDLESQGWTMLCIIHFLNRIRGVCRYFNCFKWANHTMWSSWGLDKMPPTLMNNGVM